jgi:lipopolysaccharide/colanic/teichoic acid biosynthesis glycosyltransferase
MLKRSLDFVGAGVGLICFAPFLLIIAAAIKLTSPGPVFFRQERVGKDRRLFRIYKFRSMREDSHLTGDSLTVGGDQRITPVGAFLRRHKLDELPQLINVVQGDMSLVGPRPEVQEFVNLFPREYNRILTVKPGITHQGTLMFRNEEDLLAGAVNPRLRYLHFVMPLKLRIYQDRLKQPLGSELRVILATVFPTLWLKSYPAFQLEESRISSLPAYTHQTTGPLTTADKAMEEMA